MTAKAAPDVDALLARVPYCVFLGMRARIESGAVVLDLPFDDKLIGNPILPALHGGVTGSLLETAALVQVLFETGAQKMPKPVDITIDYLRAGKPMLSHARAELVRVGRRVISARAEMWQDDAAKPVAGFRGHFLLG
ncbi:MAG: PaaI family thioesterase [Alphaproteobacteria bacterium]|nr:PaaI family thioesterase [Alphaproteobacteria bacterium]